MFFNSFSCLTSRLFRKMLSLVTLRPLKCNGDPTLTLRKEKKIFKRETVRQLSSIRPLFFPYKINVFISQAGHGAKQHVTVSDFLPEDPEKPLCGALKDVVENTRYYGCRG